MVSSAHEVKVKQEIPLTPLRRIIMTRMTDSLRTMAQVTLSSEVVVDGLVEFKEKRAPELESRHGVRITYTDLLVKIVAKLLEKHPLLNAELKDDKIVVYDEINIGVAVAIDHGLVVPVVKNANRKSLIEISKEVKELADKARKGTLTFEDVTGGTFTISNLGMFDIDVFTPIINPPQTAILGVGRITSKPVIRNGKVATSSFMWLNLTFDHRVLDGHTAALFLQDLAKILRDVNEVMRYVA